MRLVAILLLISLDCIVSDDARSSESAAVAGWGIEAFTGMTQEGEWRVVSLASSAEAGQTRGEP
jgi:hypothetical protein